MSQHTGTLALRPTDGTSVRTALAAANALAEHDPVAAEDVDAINARRRCAIQAHGLEGALAHPNPAVGSPHFSVPGVTMPWGFGNFGRASA